MMTEERTLPASARSDMWSRPLTRDRVFEQLAGDIVTMRIAPLTEVHIASLLAEHRVSRTRARQALVRLADRGLIEFTSTGRARVTAIDVHEQLQRCATTHALLGDAVDRIATRLTDEQLEALRAFSERLLADPGLMVWYGLYESIFRMAGNDIATSLFTNHLGMHLLRSCHHDALPADLVRELTANLDLLLSLLSTHDRVKARGHITGPCDATFRRVLSYTSPGLTAS